MDNIKSLLSATVQELTLPVSFGKHDGKRAWEIPRGWFDWIDKNVHPIPDDFWQRVDAAKNYRKDQPAKSEIDLTGIELYDFQRKWIQDYGSRNQAALFAEMGLGKTRTLLAMYDRRK
jgi:hypothetical protein